MIGEQAALNASIALSAFQVQDRCHVELTKQIQALGRVQIPGRLQKLSEEPPIYYDVAHNYDSLKQLLLNVQNIFSDKSLRFLLGLGIIKDIVRLREVFNGEGSIGVMTSDEMPMHPPEQWKNAFPDLEVIDYGKGSAAVANFKSDLDKTDIGIIAGSHYIAPNVYDALNFSLDRNQ
jgi:folylpolyglutamate synthase/dihydropteroate synthase